MTTTAKDESGTRTAPRSPREALAQAWSKRVRGLIEHISSTATTEELSEALAQDTSVSSLSIMLARSASAAAEYDSMAELLLAGVENQHELLEATGGVLSRDQVAQLLGIQPAAVDQRRRRNRLLAVQTLGGHWMYPAAQFTESGPLPHLTEVLDAFQIDDGWMRLDFLTSSLPALEGRTPVDLLKGEPSEEEVADLIDILGAWGA